MDDRHFVEEYRGGRGLSPSEVAAYLIGPLGVLTRTKRSRKNL